MGIDGRTLRLFADYHTHTRYSHGSGTVLENAWAARARGLREVAISDHGPANLFGVGIDSLDMFAAIRKDVEAANQKVPDVRVYLGVEANIIGTDGQLDIPEPMQSTFDLVLAGLHILVRPRSWYQATSVAAVNLLARMRRKSETAALVANTDLLVAAVYRNTIDIVTHPGYRLPIDTRELAKACAATGTAMEINSGHTHTSVKYIQCAAQCGVQFVIGSDAHTPERVGDLQRGAELAQKAGLNEYQILNALPQGRDQMEQSEVYSLWWERRQSPWRTR